MDAAKSITAIFSPTSTLTLPLPTNGTVTATGLTCDGGTCTGTYPSGSTVTLTATPQAGYQVGAWTGCTNVSADKTQCTVTLDQAHQVAVTFTPLTQPAALESPAPGSTLPGTSAVFTWTAGVSALEYWLTVGTAPDTFDVYNQGQGLALTTTVNGLPTDGNTLYLRVWTHLASGWEFTEYTLTAASGAPVKATLVTPAPNSTLTGSAATVTWSPGTGALEY